MDNVTRLKNAVKNADKRIYRWTIDSKTFAVGVILFGYSPDTLDVFLELYEVAKITFPNLKASEVTCGRVLKSDRIKGYTMILFNVDFDKDIPNGWDSYNQPLDFFF